MEHEQTISDVDCPAGSAPEQFEAFCLVRAIIGHVPPCMQQPQVHFDRHPDIPPPASTDVWKGIQRQNANTKVQKQLLITVPSV